VFFFFFFTHGLPSTRELTPFFVEGFFSFVRGLPFLPTCRVVGRYNFFFPRRRKTVFFSRPRRRPSFFYLPRPATTLSRRFSFPSLPGGSSPGSHESPAPPFFFSFFGAEGSSFPPSPFWVGRCRLRWFFPEVFFFFSGSLGGPPLPGGRVSFWVKRVSITPEGLSPSKGDGDN